MEVVKLLSSIKIKTSNCKKVLVRNSFKSR